MGTKLPASALQRLRRFLALVEAAPFNLTAWKGPELWHHGVEESLALVPALPGTAGRAVDVGSGAGFPGIPLAIVAPGWRWDLVEARRKRAEFLQAAVGELGLQNVRVCWTRAERWGRQAGREAYDFAVARAVGEPPLTAELVLPLVRVGGRAAFSHLGGMAGAQAVPAVWEALGGRLLWEAAVAGGVVWVVGKVAPTPERFPRVGKGLGRWGAKETGK